MWQPRKAMESYGSINIRTRIIPQDWPDEFDVIRLLVRRGRVVTHDPNQDSREVHKAILDVLGYIDGRQKVGVIHVGGHQAFEKDDITDLGLVRGGEFV